MGELTFSSIRINVINPIMPAKKLDKISVDVQPYSRPSSKPKVIPVNDMVKKSMPEISK